MSLLSIIIGAVFILSGQFKLPELLLIMKIPAVKIEGEKNYYFMLRSFIDFILNVLEFLKVPALMLAGLLLFDNYLIRNLLLLLFLLSAGFPWSNGFRFKDPAFYSIMMGIFFNPYTLITVPIIWGLFKYFENDPHKTAIGMVSIVFVFSLYTTYFPIATASLVIQLVLFNNYRKAEA